jgi:hypothetical protein
MPRDLLAERDRMALDGMPQLARESASSQAAAPSTQDLVDNPAPFVEERFKKMKDIHPFSALLNHEDLDDCDWLEHAAFDPAEAASREKVGDCFRQLHVRYRSSFQFCHFTSFLYHDWAAVRRLVMRLASPSLLPGLASDAVHRCLASSLVLSHPRVKQKHHSINVHDSSRVQQHRSCALRSFLLQSLCNALSSASLSLLP